jgi:putative transposase
MIEPGHESISLQRQCELIDVKRVRRPLRKMGLEAIYPKRNLSKAAPGHKIYPYLLKGLTILRSNQVYVHGLYGSF